MKKEEIIAYDTKGGNIYSKYTAKNPIVKLLMTNYLNSLDQLVNSINPDSIHEVGCGEGNLITRYLDRKCILSASDISQQIIQEAQQRIRSSAINFKVDSIYNLMY